VVVIAALVAAVAAVAGCGEQQTTTTTAASAPEAPPPTTTSSRPTNESFTHCDQNITVGPHTSCGFADNVFKAYAAALSAGASSGPESVEASSPATGKTYSLTCPVAGGTIVTCSGGSGATVRFPVWAARVYYHPTASAPPSNESKGTGETPPAKSSGEHDEVGSSSHATDPQFCAEHHCIGTFTTEPGTVVECSDGTYSHSGGISGACSHHEGVARE